PVHRLDWPENVTIFTDPHPRSHVVRDEEGHPMAVITGAGHGQTTEGSNLAVRFPEAAWDDGSRPLTPGALPHVGLLHAWVQTAGGGDEHDRYAPCQLSDLVQAGATAHI